MVRLIVMSATYRQDSHHARPSLREIDPEQPAARVADAAAARGGVRARQRAGRRRPAEPRARRPERAAVSAGRATTRTSSSPTATTCPSTDERQYRRGLYMHWQRTFLHPMLANFDAPSREECTASRIVSNTPQQALTLLNDPELRRGRARPRPARAGGAGCASDERLHRLALRARALARTAARASARRLLAFLSAAARVLSQPAPRRPPSSSRVGATPARRRRSRPNSPPGPASAASILNLHETITRY